MTRAETILLALFIVVAVFVAQRAQSFGTAGAPSATAGLTVVQATPSAQLEFDPRPSVPSSEAPSSGNRAAAASPSSSAADTRTPSPATPKPTQQGDGGAVAGGTASFVDPSFGARYLALPQGPGHRVRICDRRMRRCVWRTSTDAGPSLQRQREGRVADVSFADFRWLCRCDPWAKGLLKVVVVGP